VPSLERDGLPLLRLPVCGREWGTLNVLGRKEYPRPPNTELQEKDAGLFRRYQTEQAAARGAG